MDGGEELRIVLLGKTGVGKSSAGNRILGEKVFKESSLSWGLSFCKRAEKVINGRKIVVIDTPGIFDTDLTEEDLKYEVISSLEEWAPGPHVFIVVLKVERYTQENQQTVEKLLEYFTDDVLNHVVLLFTHGDELRENMAIHDFIDKSDVEGKKSGKQSLKGLVERCGNRVHVIDNKYWNENRRVSDVLATLQRLNLSEQAIREITEKMMLTPADKTPWFNVLMSDEADNISTGDGYESVEQSQREYRTNTYQLTQLMKSVKNILKENNGQHYIYKLYLEKIMQEINGEGKRFNTEKSKRGARTSAREVLSGVATETLAVLTAPAMIVANRIRSVWRRLTY